MIVVDASVFVDLIMQSEKADAAQHMLGQHGEWLAAEHLDLEVTNSLRKKLLSGTLQPERAQQALDVFCDFQIIRFAAQPFVPMIWSMRHNMTPYDAAYVAIARTFGVSFVTSDARLHSACNQIVTTQLL